MKRAKGKPLVKGWWIIAFVAVMIAAFSAKAWCDTMSDPLVRRLEIPFDTTDGPAEDIRIVLIADIHVSGPDLPPERLEGIVDRVNRLKPDLILIAGDFVSDRKIAKQDYPVRTALAPLARLDPTTPRISVPGNHDYWHGIAAIEAELVRLGITVLRNQIAHARGLTIGGLDDDFTGHADLPFLIGMLKPSAGPVIILSHSPDPFLHLPGETGIMLSGHTHCGQIAWPWGGSPATMSKYGQRYSCGVVRENGNILVTSAGLGTSILPFRLFTRPEIWLINLRR